MISSRGLMVHGGVLVLAGVLGWSALTKEDEEGVARHEAELWDAPVDALQQIEFESKTRKVVLQAQKDEQGRYFVGMVDKEKARRPKPPPRHPTDGDAGAPPSVEEEPVERETLRFVGVSDANEMAEQLANLKAKRTLGKLEPARFEEFGFGGDEQSTLRVILGGQARELVLGGKTPGGGDIYVRNPANEEAYVVDGNLSRQLESAESRLLERKFHEWEDSDAVKVTIQTEGASRELARNKDQQSFWTSPGDSDAKDETASNWMNKLERMRVTEYVEKPEPPPTRVFRVEYFGADGKPIGWLELASQPDPEKDGPRYLARSEQSRWYGVVINSVGEQLAQDITSVVNP